MSKASRVIVLIAGVLGLLACAESARAQSTGESLCDPSTTDCRTPLLNLIRSENVGIDVGFWFMEDSRFATELINRWRAGVPVRVLVDTKANPAYPGNVTRLQMLQDAGIPMRRYNTSYLHWKVMVFAGQNMVEFGSANYSPSAFLPTQAGVDFQDETVYFTNDAAIVNSFKTKFDDAWVNTSGFVNYANVTEPLTRSYPVFPISSAMNFPPSQNFGTRSAARYNAEPASGGIDAINFRINDPNHTNAIIAARARGVPVRLYLEQGQYRDPSRPNSAYEVDRLYMAGVQMKQRAHQGWNHEKLALLHNQRMAIFGSQNWTQTSGQYEHNYFTTKAWIYDWFVDQFERKWNSSADTEPFTPLPPDTPVYQSPSSGAQIQATEATLRWYAGPWGQKYDIYFGTSSNPPLLEADVQLGPSASTSDYKSYVVTGLAQDQTYYWKIVSKTFANLSRTGTVWNFRTGEPPAPGEGDVVLWASHASLVRGGWTLTGDSTAAGGARLGTANAGVSQSSPLASPTDYFEMSFIADAGVPYRLWIRGKAASNSWASDSVHVQFSDSVTSSGVGTWRIGSTSATTVQIEDCSGCGLSGWGWNDNSMASAGALGTPVYFANSGAHTVRIQKREDGLSIDQIVLSRSAFLSSAPGTTKNDGTILPEAGGTSGGPPPPPPLPAGWQSADIGAVGSGGFANENNGTFTVQGAGADVWGTADAFHYAYRSLSGDGSITARVASLTGSQAWTKVGVMIRGSTSPSSAHAFMIVSKSKGLAFQYRTANGATSLSISGGTGTAPRWVRLTRSGNVITAAVSSNGTSWTDVGSDTFTMSSDVLVGLATSSHTTSSVATGLFDQVTVVP